MKLLIICRCTKYAKEFMEMNNLTEDQCIAIKTWGKAYEGVPGQRYVIIRPYPPGPMIQWVLRLKSKGLTNVTRNYLING